MIEKTTSIEDLVTRVPESVRYMMNNGLKCIACGEPVWGSVESLAKEKGWSDDRIAELVNDLNGLDGK